MDFPEDPKTGRLIWRSSAKGISQELADLIDDLMATFPEKRPRNTRMILQRIEEVKSPSLRRAEFIKQTVKWVGLASLGTVTSGWLMFQGLIWANRSFDLKIDNNFGNLATDSYTSEEINKAHFFSQLAIIFNPDNFAAQYTFGKICELQQQLDCARKQYQIVIQGNNAEATGAAINSLTRLQILSKRAQDVDVNLIKKKVQQTNSSIIQAALYKNLGWVFWEQNRLQEAEGYLRKAIEIAPVNEYNYASPYCLLAQVKETQKADALKEWDICYNKAKIFVPEEQVWASMARQRLRASGNQVE